MGAGVASAEPVTVVAFGDSLTQGFGLPADQGFVPQLEAWLQSNGADVSLINAGVSGDTTAGGLSRINWTLTDEVDAVIVALGGNDVLRGLPPEDSRANLDGILAAVSGRGLPALLVGLPAPSNFGDDYKATFDSIFPDLAESYDTLLYPNFLAALTQSTERAEALRLYMQADAIHPNAAGVELMVEDIGPVVLQLIERATAR